MSGENKKLWGGRFSQESADITERLSASVHYDRRMYRQDIRGSIAHAKMLAGQGLLSEEELAAIISGLEDIEREIEAGSFSFSQGLEDIHMNIEAELTKRIGEAGKKLHTARSRNDQVAADVRMYLIDETTDIRQKLSLLIKTLIGLAEKNISVLMPGYTHMQIAQPIRLSQHILAYGWQLIRDMRRLNAAHKAASCLPLGCGALAGVNYKNDREFLASELGFEEIICNSIDAVSDRDFVLDFLYFSAVCGVHLSRFCEELVLWSTAEFGFIRLADGVTTGSSIMPQKRNPDLAELIRGKAGRLYGNLISVLTVLKGLPMAYNRDLQEDKEPLFDSIDTIKLCLEGMDAMLSTVSINRDKMLKELYMNFSTATDIADYLVKKGVPFREAHGITGAIVRMCEEEHKDFFKLRTEELKRFSPAIDDDIAEYLKPESSPERKLSSGSTAKAEIEKQLDLIKKALSEAEKVFGLNA